MDTSKNCREPKSIANKNGLLFSVASIVVALSAVFFQVLYIAYSNKQSAIERTLKFVEFVNNAPQIKLLQKFAREYERVSYEKNPKDPQSKNALYHYVIKEHSSITEVEDAAAKLIQFGGIIYRCGNYQNVFRDKRWIGAEYKTRLKEITKWIIEDSFCDRRTLNGYALRLLNEIHYFNKRIIYCNDFVYKNHQDYTHEKIEYSGELSKLELVLIDFLNQEKIDGYHPFKIFRTYEEGKAYEEKTDDKLWLNVQLSREKEC